MDRKPVAQIGYGFLIPDVQARKRILDYCTTKTEAIKKTPSSPPKVTRKRSHGNLQRTWSVGRFFPSIKEPTYRRDSRDLTAEELSPSLKSLLEPLFMDIEEETGISLQFGETGTPDDVIIALRFWSISQGGHIEVPLLDEITDRGKKALWMASSVLGHGNERLSLFLCCKI